MDSVLEGWQRRRCYRLSDVNPHSQMKVLTRMQYSPFSGGSHGVETAAWPRKKELVG